MMYQPNPFRLTKTPTMASELNDVQNKPVSFQQQLQTELEDFIAKQSKKYPADELLKIDLHCHDYNSDVPDEILGRILGVPETWLKSEKLIENLKKNGCTAFTITNHNNARSCHQLNEKGYDILVGAEFSVTVPDYQIGIHVLTYGFTGKHEKRLNKLRYSVYEFLKYAHAHNIPTIWAHPLYHYVAHEQPPIDFFHKMSLLFERFEVINGQRDTWQNMLVKNWIQNLTPEMIDANAQRFGIDLSQYTHKPYQKAMCGGSDDHMGIFVGHSGSYLYVPNLKERLKTTSKSALALEALREHRIIPFGGHQNMEKLSIAFLDYVFQVAINKIKPDLVRMLLHKGSVQDKILAFVLSNLFAELKYHKTTMLFIKLFHQSFVGKRPNRMVKLLIKKAYKPIFDEAINIVEAHDLEPDKMTAQFNQALITISDQLNSILFKRLQKKVDAFIKDETFSKLSFDQVFEKLEISPNIRDLIESSTRKHKEQKKKFNDFIDGLSFPFLSSTLLLAANFTSTKVLYNSRKLLTSFSSELGILNHPKRMLWLTDTFDDKNGVSSVLQEMHREIKRLNLPIDLLVCSNTIQPDEHLVVMKPEAEFVLPIYQEQAVRIPNINQIHRLFLENEYDRLICSTEGIMGWIAVLLKNAYSVPAYFYIHTDWIMFARKTMKWDTHEIDRVRRILRLFYGQFDKLFVLNTDHKEWLSSREMEFEDGNICLTAHWIDERFKPQEVTKMEVFSVAQETKVLLFAGRLSKEKGVMDLVKVYKKVKEQYESVKIVFAGVGPAEAELRAELPTALFMGWVPSNKLPSLYSAADILLLPSKFDTFGLVVLEALSCGLPVAAYDAKGPKDIIVHESCGFIASNIKKMAENVIYYLQHEEKHPQMKQNALARAKEYAKEEIMQKFLSDIDLA